MAIQVIDSSKFSAKQYAPNWILSLWPGRERGVMVRFLEFILRDQNIVTLTLKDLLNPFCREKLSMASVLVVN